MYGAVRIPSVSSPGKDQAIPAVPPPSVVAAAAAAPAAALPVAVATPEADRSPPAQAKTPTPPEGKTPPALAEPTSAPPPVTGPAEVIESTPDLVEPPHLPMGWIIGALFALALLLTLWIAHRAGAFGPPTPDLPIDPNSSTTLPRMP